MKAVVTVTASVKLFDGKLRIWVNVPSLYGGLTFIVTNTASNRALYKKGRTFTLTLEPKR